MAQMIWTNQTNNNTRTGIQCRIMISNMMKNVLGDKELLEEATNDLVLCPITIQVAKMWTSSLSFLYLYLVRLFRMHSTTKINIPLSIVPFPEKVKDPNVDAFHFRRLTTACSDHSSF